MFDVGPSVEATRAAKACLTAIWVEILLRTLPLTRCCRLLGIAPPHAPATVRALSPDASRLSAVDRAVRRAYARSLLPDTCLRRALTQGTLLRELGPTLRLGVRKSGTELLAHAWIEFAGHPLTPTGAERLGEGQAHSDCSAYVPLRRP